MRAGDPGDELSSTLPAPGLTDLDDPLAAPTSGPVRCLAAAAESSSEVDWAAERQDILDRFLEELTKATGDGSKKRQSGQKPAWYLDDAHEGAVFSHITKWKRGEMVDPDSGAHPLVHVAWRCLAIACSENGNNPAADGKEPEEDWTVSSGWDGTGPCPQYGNQHYRMGMGICPTCGYSNL